MFHQQVPILDELRELIPPRAVDILVSLMSNPAAVISHGGPFTIVGNRRPWVPIPQRQPNLVVAPQAIAQFDGRAHILKWARVVEPWTTQVNLKSGLTEYWVVCRDCDADGLHNTGPKVDVRLCMTGGQQPSLNVDDLLAWGFDLDGTRISFPCNGATYYASPVVASAPFFMSSAGPSNTDEQLEMINVRHLLYHVYAPRDSESWRKNIRQLAKRWDLFNGRRIVAIVEDSMGQPARTVQDEFAAQGVNGIEWIVMDNDPRIRETSSFETLLRKVRSTARDEAVFYAHTKGGSYNEDHMMSKGVMYWRNAMYHSLLDNWPSIERDLNSHPMVGTCIVHWDHDKFTPFPTQIDPRFHWMFAGTYFWFRSHRVFSNPYWTSILDDRYAVEAWPAQLFRHDEVKTVYQPWPIEQYPNPNPYLAATHTLQIEDD